MVVSSSDEDLKIFHGIKSLWPGQGGAVVLPSTSPLALRRLKCNVEGEGSGMERDKTIC